MRKVFFHVWCYGCGPLIEMEVRSRSGSTADALRTGRAELDTEYAKCERCGGYTDAIEVMP